MGPDKYFESDADKQMAVAIANGDVTAVEHLITSGSVDPLTVGREAVSWLKIAILTGQRTVLEKLLELGALGDPKGSIAGQALYTATILDDPFWLKRLHAAGADLNNYGGGDLLLVTAMDTRNQQTLDYYLDNGADINMPTNVKGSVALSAACAYRFDMVNFFLNRGAFPWVMDSAGSTLGLSAEDAGKLPGWDHQSQMNQERELLLSRLHAIGFPSPAPTAAQARELREAGQWPPPNAPQTAPRLPR